MIFPRVIIVGETFRLNGGGGITMSNLFKDWPSEKIGVITDRIAETNPKTSYLYYQLGHEEIKFPFPFSLIQTYFHSGPYYFDAERKPDVVLNSKRGILHKIKKTIRPKVDYFLKRTGLFFRFYRIKPSENIIKWIMDFNPDVLYIQPFNHNIMKFGNSLYQILGLPYVIHIMDDSIKYINQSIIFRKCWQNLIESDFKELIDNAKVCLCISESMSAEYLRRYGTVFLPFRNPIEMDKWVPYRKKTLEVNSGTLKIIYTGRLFSPTFDTLLDLCSVVDNMNSRNKSIVLEIFTHDKNPVFFDAIKSLTGIRLCQPVGVEEIPQLIQQYDIFFLCLDFDKKSQDYSQFSISTRTSEGMISGVPILIYAPKNSAQYIYFDENGSGCLVGERDLMLLEESISRLWNDISFRERISKNAVNKAMADSEATGVRERFRRTLASFNEDKNP